MSSSSSLQSINAVNILANQLCVINSYSTYITIFLLIIVTVSTFLFIYQVYNTFYSIIRLYPNISSYCSDPRGYGTRYLLSMTFIIGYLLVFLCIEEQQVKTVTTMSLTLQQMVQFYLQISVNLCFPLLALFYLRGKGPLRNHYYRLNIGIKLPIIFSECIHYLSATSWLIVMIYYNTNFAFDNYYVAITTKPNGMLSAIVYLISALMALVSCIAWFGTLGVLSIYEDDHDDNLTYYCPDCTPNEVYKIEKSYFKLAEQIDKNACLRCLRSTPTRSGSINLIDGYNELSVTIEYQEKREKEKNLVGDWFKLHLFPRTIEYKTYTQLHAYGFIIESIAFIVTALLGVVGSVLRKRQLCEQIGFGF